MECTEQEANFAHQLNTQAIRQDSAQSFSKLRQYFRLVFERIAACRLYRMHGIEYQQDKRSKDNLKQK